MSARGDIVMPLGSSFASTKLSTGFATNSARCTGGGAISRTGWKAQCFALASAMRASMPFGTIGAAAPSGQGAPIAIHCSTRATFASSSLPGGGILSSPSCRRAWTIRLLRGSPAFATAPCSPPLRKASRLSRRSPAFCFSAPWHEMQCSASSGRTLFSKNSMASAAGTGAGMSSALAWPRRAMSRARRTHFRAGGNTIAPRALSERPGSSADSPR